MPFDKERDEFTSERGSSMLRVLGEVAEERNRQDAKHGPDFPAKDGTGKNMSGALRVMIPSGDAAKSYYEHCKDKGRHVGANVLVEEVCEALDEDDPVKLRAELIQVAAVAVKWIQAIDRRSAVVTAAPEASPAEECGACGNTKEWHERHRPRHIFRK